MTGSSLPARAAAVRSTNRSQESQNILPRKAGITQDPAGSAILLLSDGEQQVLGAEILVLQLLGLIPGNVQNLGETLRGVYLRTRHARQPAQFSFNRPRDDLRPYPGALKDRGHHTVGLIEQREEQVLRLQLLMLPLARQLLGRLQRLL